MEASLDENEELLKDKTANDVNSIILDNSTQDLNSEQNSLVALSLVAHSSVPHSSVADSK